MATSPTFAWCVGHGKFILRLGRKPALLTLFAPTNFRSFRLKGNPNHTVLNLPKLEDSQGFQARRSHVLQAALVTARALAPIARVLAWFAAGSSTTVSTFARPSRTAPCLPRSATNLRVARAGPSDRPRRSRDASASPKARTSNTRLTTRLAAQRMLKKTILSLAPFYVDACVLTGRQVWAAMVVSRTLRLSGFRRLA